MSENQSTTESEDQHEEQNIDPALLSDDNPAGINLHNKPFGVKRINKKGLIAGAAIMGIAAIVAATTFNQTGGAVSDAAVSAVASQSKTGGRVGDVKRDTLWYAQVPDTMDRPSPSGMQFGAPPAATPRDEVPDLTGKGVSPLTAATAAKTTATSLGEQAGNAAAGATSATTPPPPTAAELQAQQKAQQAEQRKAQELEQAMKAGLTVAGFGEKSQVVQAGSMAGAGAGNAGGFLPASLPAGAAQQREDDQNKQERKDAFLKTAKSSVDSDYSTSVKKKAQSPYEVKAGAVIPAVMIGGINSDLPGQVIAQVRENVYDTKSGMFLLIPQGSRLIGMYDSHVAYGQKRILLAWNRIIYPNGDSFNLKGMPGADKAGYAGFFDQVDNHYLKIFGSAVMMSLISAGVQLSQPNNGSSSNTNQTPSVSQTVGAALGQQIGQTAMTITQKNLNIQPTLEIRPGYQFNVMVTADMILPPTGAQ